MIVCADDFGLRGDIDSAVLELAASGKLSAVSCMVALDRCTPEALGALPASGVDVGLHLCLTEERVPLSWVPVATLPPPPSFRGLLARSLSRHLSYSELTAKITAQYDLFVAKRGQPPDFIDGHLYVHQFPGVSDALLRFVLRLSSAGRPYIRNTRASLRALRIRRLPVLKSWLIGFYGVGMFRRLRALGLSTNNGFAGIYAFGDSRFREYLPRFVDCLPERTGLLVVHPGKDEEWRRNEFFALRDFEFPSGSPNRFQPRPAPVGGSG